MKRAISTRLAGLAGALALLSVAVVLTLTAPVRAMEIQRVVSPGGIEAWLVEEHTVPLVALNFAFRGGSSQDPADKPGVAELLSSLLDEGAGDLDSKTFQERMQDQAVKLSFSARRDAFTGSMRTLAANLDEAVELLRLAVNEPRFDEEPVARMKAQLVARLRGEEKDPESIAFKKWYAAAFPNHPYGRSASGTVETMSAITIEDVRALRKRMFVRKDMKVAVVGAIDAKTLAPLLDTLFGALPAEGDLEPIADVAPVTGTRVVEPMDVPQTVIRFGTTGLKRNDPDFMPAYVMNHILGGGTFSSRLYNEVREKRGLAYSIYTFLAPYDHAGIFLGGTATRADRADETLRLIEEEIARMAKDGPTADELAKAKSYLIGSYPLQFDTSTKIASALINMQLDDLGIDYMDTRTAKIEAITLDDVKKVAKRLLDNGGLTIAIVGKANAS
ncbi:MAG: peptidase M16 [Hyphomicrobiales bacterium]|nr:MAG: peptidase M16 [Hyphomicrobiales bacterium]